MPSSVACLFAAAMVTPAAESIPSDPKFVARLVGDAFLKESSPPGLGASGDGTSEVSTSFRGGVRDDLPISISIVIMI